MPTVLPVAEDAVLVHIGPYKTGTTAIQAVLASHRADLEQHGVWYPGEGNRHAREGWALRGRAPKGLPKVPGRVWEDFATGVRAREGRVVISTEDLVNLPETKVSKAVQDLGSERVHMLVVARRLDTLIPSAWQQRVKTSHETLTFDEFVRAVVSQDRTSTSAREFWHNHDLAGVLHRWLAVLPPERVTVLVADEGDRVQLPRTFEALLELPEGLLRGDSFENTSLTLERAEFYRRMSLAFEKHDWSPGIRRKTMVRGVLPGLMTTGRREGEARIPAIPAWADEQMHQLSQDRAESIRTSGCSVIGDPDALLYQPVEPRPDGSEVPEVVGIDTMVAAVESLVEVFVDTRERLEAKLAVAEADQDTPSPSDLGPWSSRDLLREVVRRQKRRLGR